MAQKCPIRFDIILSNRMGFSHIVKEITELVERKKKMKFEKINDLAIKYSKRIKSIKTSPLDICIDVPFDEKCGGLNLIASRPGTGKTTYTIQMAVSIAAKKQIPVYIISLEDSAKSFTKHFSKMMNIKSEKMIVDLPIYICDDSPLSINEMKESIENEIKDGVVIIDYLNLIKSSSIIQSMLILGEIAKSKNIPIIVLSYISAAMNSTIKQMCDQIEKNKNNLDVKMSLISKPRSAKEEPDPMANESSKNEIFHDEIIDNFILLYRIPFYITSKGKLNEDAGMTNVFVSGKNNCTLKYEFNGKYYEKSNR